MLPTAKLISFLADAIEDTDSSGSDVPMAITVMPMKSGDSLKQSDKISESLISVLVERRSKRIPPIKISSSDIF